MELRVNDFETVREELNADDHNERTMREANAALDRIEAEVERHRQHICWIDDELRAEVERLRAALESCKRIAEAENSIIYGIASNALAEEKV